MRLFPVDMRLFPVDMRLFPVDMRLFPVDMRLFPVDMRLFRADRFDTHWIPSSISSLVIASRHMCQSMLSPGTNVMNRRTHPHI